MTLDSTPASAVIQVRCHEDECGMISAYRFWRDGSHQKILDACWHPKRFPTEEKIAAALAREKEAA